MILTSLSRWKSAPQIEQAGSVCLVESKVSFFNEASMLSVAWLLDPMWNRKSVMSSRGRQQHRQQMAKIGMTK
jgi:hypothetical protein